MAWDDQPDATSHQKLHTLSTVHKGDMSKAPLHSIMATAPLDLLHVNFTGIEITLEPNQSLMSWYSKTTS